MYVSTRWYITLLTEYKYKWIIEDIVGLPVLIIFFYSGKEIQSWTDFIHVHVHTVKNKERILHFAIVRFCKAQ